MASTRKVHRIPANVPVQRRGDLARKREKAAASEGGREREKGEREKGERERKGRERKGRYIKTCRANKVI